MKKILFILHTPPPVHGSSMVGKYILESEKINLAFTCKYIDLGTSGSIDEIGRGGLQKIGRYLCILFKVIFLLVSFRPHLCYIAITTQGLGFYKDSIIALIVRFFRIKRVYHFHNKGVESKHNNMFDHLLYRLVFQKAYVIILSKYLHKDVEKYVPKNRLFICANGIPEISSILKPNQRKSKTKCLFLSNLLKSKGVFLLLDSIKYLQGQNHNLFFVSFVGGEGDITGKEFTSRINNLGISQYAAYLGGIFGDEKNHIFSSSDIFVHPTFNDCFPLVIIEAMQHSLPVISTYEGGIPDIVKDGETGFLVPKNDPVALAEKLELLIKNPELRNQMGQAGRKRYEELFKLDKFEKNLKNILNMIISKY